MEHARYLMAVFLIGTGSPAAADLCDLIKSIDRIESRIATGPTTRTTTTLQQLADNTDILKTFFPRNAALRAALRDYTASVDQIMVPTDTPPSVKQAQLAAPETRRLLQNMLSASSPVCGTHSYLMLSSPQESASNPADLTTRGIRGGFSAWTADFLAFAALLITTLITLGGAVYLFRKRGRRTKRIMCNIPVSIRTGAMDFRTRIFDISSKGAKIKLPDDPVPSQDATITIKGIDIPARITWQNGHFAGVVFADPLLPADLRSILAARPIRDHRHA